MILIDSNILIYSAEEKYKYLRGLYTDDVCAVSMISKLEVLGYHSITKEQVAYFQSIFNLVDLVPITDNVIEQAVFYRKKFSMSTGDSIIAATTKLHGYKLYTNNVEDFVRIQDFEIINPLDKKDV